MDRGGQNRSYYPCNPTQNSWYRFASGLRLESSNDCFFPTSASRVAMSWSATPSVPPSSPSHLRLERATRRTHRIRQSSFDGRCQDTACSKTSSATTPNGSAQIDGTTITLWRATSLLGLPDRSQKRHLAVTQAPPRAASMPAPPGLANDRKRWELPSSSVPPAAKRQIASFVRDKTGP